MADIAKRVMKKYENHNRNYGAAKTFIVLLYCKTGLHRSIAAAKGLQRFLQYDKRGKIIRSYVRVRNLMQRQFDSKCTIQWWGYPRNEKLAEIEWNLVRKALQ